MNKSCILFFFCFFLLWVLPAHAQSINENNVVWTSPSQNSGESMPCGGGSIGMNVWAENGDVYFYFSRSGTFDENNALLKGGRVKLHLKPNPFESGDFRQELKLGEGSVVITAGKGKKYTEIELWTDVYNPIIHLDVKSQTNTIAQVSYESWRYEDFVLRENESYSNSYKFAPPKGLKVNTDSIRFKDGAVEFFHRNLSETVFDVTVKSQGMEGVKANMMNPLADLTWGGKMIGDNFDADGTYLGTYSGTDFKGWKLKSKAPAKNHQLQIFLHTEQTATLDNWKQGLNRLVGAEKKANKRNREKSLVWWKSFWDRSYIQISPRKTTDKAWQVGRNYQLFRYMLACNAYGEYPTKFNGGLFTFDPQYVDSTKTFTPDFRLWGGGTMTAQNQRLVYFPMIKSGDFDMMKPQFEFYERILHNAELRSQIYWGHDGACFTEQIENFGLPNISEDKWKPRGPGADRGVESNPWLEYTWDTALEFGQMMLDSYSYNNEPIAPHLPFIESVLTFFDEHYRYLASKRGTHELDGDGHLVIFPGSAAETYKMATNATSTVAALQTILKRLIELPDTQVTKDERIHWQTLLDRIPPLSFRELEGSKALSPAKIWERVNNSETPQLYPVFPWRIYGVGRPDIEIAINTYNYDPDALKFRSHIGWKQDNIFAACLGLTEEAKRLTLLKLANGPYRFPAFWGPGFDWSPDHNWGGSGMIGLQEMLLQSVNDKILLFPTWPSDWDVHFKLHAPNKTIVEAQVKNGRITFLKVTPESRRKDVVISNSQLEGQKEK